MARVFISYSRTDRVKARTLAVALEDYGHEVWWDGHLVAGDDFQDVIEEKLSLVDAIIVMWTKTSVAKNWVVAEARLGIERKNLIPVRYSSKVLPSEEFSHLHVEYLGGWDGAMRAPEINTLAGRIGQLKSASDRENLSNLLGPKIKVRLQKSDALKTIFDSALPGGLRVHRFLLGALASAGSIWFTLFIVDVVAGDGKVGTGSFILLFLALSLSRALDQILIASKKQTCDRFFDKAFSLSSIVCALVATAMSLCAILWTHAHGGDIALNIYFNVAVGIAVTLLVVSYGVRSVVAAGRMLQSRV